MMKIIFLVLTLVLCFCEKTTYVEAIQLMDRDSVPAELDDSKERNEKAWIDFKTKYGRKYSSAEEEAHRKQIFLDNVKEIEAFNRLYALGIATHRKGINQFADKSPAELKALKFGG